MAIPFPAMPTVQALNTQQAATVRLATACYYINLLSYDSQASVLTVSAERSVSCG